jgi:putative intracellular protease/amidase
MTRIAIIAFDGVTDIDLFTHWDILHRPLTAYPEAGRRWEVRLLGDKPQHATAAGLNLAMHGMIDEAREADAVLVSSGPMTRRLMLDKEYLERLALDPRRQIVAAQCSGALILAASGLLKGRTATTYPTACKELEDFGALFVEKPLVAHERIATAAGCMAGPKLDFWILRQLLGWQLASLCVDSAEAWGRGLERLFDVEETEAPRPSQAEQAA